MEPVFANRERSHKQFKRKNHLLRKVKFGRISSRAIAVAKVKFWENTYNFTENTTLHGLKFAGDKNISLFERVFFLSAFFVALGLASNFIYITYAKWSMNPVIIARSAASTYINQIPFPAVTICNMNQVLKSKVSKLNRNSAEYTILQTVCAEEGNSHKSNTTYKWIDYANFLLKNSQRCDQMLLMCRYATLTFNCTDLFKPVLTEDGRCCVFNAVDTKFMYLNASVHSYAGHFIPDDIVGVDWTPEFGYPQVLPPNYYPLVAYGTGFSMGLTVVLNTNTREYFCSSTNGLGFKVILHSPIEAPNVGDDGFSLQAGYETRVVINPFRAEASENIRDLRMDARQCAYGNEVNLSYFRTYSRRNCEIECEARLVLAECNCILYYMPLISLNASICGITDKDCYGQVKVRAQSSDQISSNCSRECIQSCYDLTYKASAFRVPISHRSYLIREPYIETLPLGFAEENVAVAHFYYVENAFRSNKKEEFIGLTEFLSSIGGIMGLFIGFSTISLVEILYYITIRPFYSRLKQNIIIVEPFGSRQTSVKSSSAYGSSQSPQLQQSNLLNSTNPTKTDNMDFTMNFRRDQITL